MIKEHERAVLTMDLPEYGLQAGDVGVVVHIYKDGEAYEVEFFTLEGDTLDVVTVEAGESASGQPTRCDARPRYAIKRVGAAQRVSTLPTSHPAPARAPSVALRPS